MPNEKLFPKRSMEYHIAERRFNPFFYVPQN
jgi:hypothetical protein